MIRNESALQDDATSGTCSATTTRRGTRATTTSSAARVLTNPASRFDQTRHDLGRVGGGDRGAGRGRHRRGLVGQVTKVFRGQSVVTLATDESSAVRAVDLYEPGAVGILGTGAAADSLVLDRVTKDKNVRSRRLVITAGSPGRGELPSLYPREIPIGIVTSVDQNDTDSFKRIQVKPFVDFSSLQSVLVLVPKGRRAELP